MATDGVHSGGEKGVQETTYLCIVGGAVDDGGNSYSLFCKYIYVPDNIHINNVLYYSNVDIPLCM